MGVGHWVIWALAALGLVALIRMIVSAVVGPRRRGGCGRCGYDVRNLNSWTCPECGADLREEGVLGPGLARRTATRPWMAIGAWTILTSLLAGVIFSEIFEPPVRLKTFVRYTLVLAPVSGDYGNLVLEADGVTRDEHVHFTPSWVRVRATRHDGSLGGGLEVETLPPVLRPQEMALRMIDDKDALAGARAPLGEEACFAWLDSLAAGRPKADGHRDREAWLLARLIHGTAVGYPPEAVPYSRDAPYDPSTGASFTSVSSTIATRLRPVFDFSDLASLGVAIFLLALWFLVILLILRLRRRFLPGSAAEGRKMVAP